MEDQAWVQLLFIGVIAYLFHLWLSDLRQQRQGTPNPKALHGATPCKTWIAVLGILGALLILALETAGEIYLNISSEQKDITILYGLLTLAAPIGEEIIFRGYLVIDRKGPGILILSIILFSIIFTLCHPFLWTWENSALQLHFTSKAWFTSAILLLNSLWFYALRFNPWNHQKSLIPCFSAHIASNLGVVVIKALQGHITGWF